MAFSLKLKMAKGFLGWSGGGGLVLLSLALHGLLLSLPLTETEATPAEPPTEQAAPATGPSTRIDVVRLPASPPKAEAIPKAPDPVASNAPRLVAEAPAQPVASAPTSPALGAEAPPRAPSAPEPPDLLPPEPPPVTLDDRLRDPAEYRFNDQAKSLIADEVTFHMAVVPTWLEEEGQGLSDDAIPVLGTKLPPLQVAYPINTCLVPPPVEGLVGVIVTSTGQLAKDPVLLDSTGYTVLDEKALDLARQQTFAPLPAGTALPNPRADWLPVQVQYDAANCTP